MDYPRFVLHNWRLLGFGVLLTAFSSFGQTFFIALFGAELRGAFGLSHGGLGTLYAVATLGSALTLIWLGGRIDRTDLRLYAGLSAGGIAVACLIMAAAPGPAILLVALFALRLTGQGLLTHTAMTTMARRFQADRGRAIGIAVLGLPLGEAVFPALAVASIAAIGWRASWVAASILAAAVLIPSILLLLRGDAERPERSSPEPADDRRIGPVDATRQTTRSWSRRQVVADPRFYAILAVVMAPPFLITGFFFHQTHLAATKGWTLSWIATCFVAYAAANVVGALATGPLVDRIGAQRLLPAYLAPLSIALLVLAVSSAPAAAMVYMISAGFGMGAGVIVQTALWAEIYGTVHLGAVRALTTSLMVVASALSPPLMGGLIDRGVTMESIALVAIGYCVMATACWVLMRRRRPARARP